PAGREAILLVETLLIGGPFVAMSALLFHLGLCVEGRALREQLRLEAATGLGAVWPDEVDGLVNPRRRAARRREALRRGGWRAYDRLRRVQEAQLNLCMERWHRDRKELDEPLAAEAELRRRVLRLRP